MYASLVAVCLIGGAFAQPWMGPQLWNQQQAGQAAYGQAGQADYGQAAYGGGANEAAQAGAGSAAAEHSENAAHAQRVAASAARRMNENEAVRRRQSVLLAADHEEGAGFEGYAHSSGAAGASDSGAVVGYCSGIPMTGSDHLCCQGQYYGNTWSELDCCGNSIYDSRFYGCKNNVMSPLYKPLNDRPEGLNSGRLCGNYVWQMYKAPYELCCEDVHYPNPYGNYGCCGARAYDTRFYNCGRDEVKQRWYVYKRSTFVLAATEEVEAVRQASESGVGSIEAEEAAKASSHTAAREQQAAQGNAANFGAQAGQAGQGQAQAGGAYSQGQGQAGGAYGGMYGAPYFGGPWGNMFGNNLNGFGAYGMK